MQQLGDHQKLFEFDLVKPVKNFDAFELGEVFFHLGFFSHAAPAGSLGGEGKILNLILFNISVLVVFVNTCRGIFCSIHPDRNAQKEDSKTGASVRAGKPASAARLLPIGA
jgi:hypothetical protein